MISVVVVQVSCLINFLIVNCVFSLQVNGIPEERKVAEALNL